jgi:uncharacterized protein (TIGR03086 family)
MTMPDLEPATRQMAALVQGVRDDMLGRPTPCPDYTLGDLLDHVGGLTVAFTAAARKHVGEGAATSQGASGDASRLTGDWRARIATDLAALAEAWRDPAAWQGMTRAGGIDLPGDVAGVVAIDELVIHGWDVARSSGQPFGVDDELLGLTEQFVAQAAADPSGGEGLFGPPVAVAEDAPRLDRVVALSGRDPGWQG